jgi:hypothetical protein
MLQGVRKGSKSMNGSEIEGLLSLIENSTMEHREQLLAFIEKNRVQILADLQANGKAEVAIPGGDTIVLTKTAA